MILYHGSNIEIEAIDLSKSKPYKDFGRGFYLSADKMQALRMAEQRTSIELSGKPIINCFSFDESALTDGTLKVLSFDDYSIEWTKFVLQNRDHEVKQPSHHYDVVYGPIADDRVGVQIRLFQQEYISIETLVERLKFIRPTFQYFFGTDASLNYIVRKGVIA